MMSINEHLKRGLGLLACAGLLLALGAAPVRAQQEEGASGAVRDGMDNAGPISPRCPAGRGHRP